MLETKEEPNVFLSKYILVRFIYLGWIKITDLPSSGTISNETFKLFSGL